MSEQLSDFSPIDNFHVGRRRKPNFTDHEVLNIIDQYEVYKELLHSREASKTVIAQKQAIWKQITENLNAAYPQVERTVEDVRRKWKKLQSEAKREVTAHRAAQQAGTATPVSSRQINFYHRILSICRAPNPLHQTTPFNTNPTATASNNHHHHHHHHHSSSMNLNNGTMSSNHEQFSDKIDSPSSDVPNGHVDSPGDESPSSMVNDDASASPATNFPPTSLSTFVNFQHSTMNNGGSVSKRTLDKQRKQLKSGKVQQFTVNTSTASTNINKCSNAPSTSLRYESLAKRKRTLDMTSQRLIYDKECLLLERKNLELKLAMNENELERINIEKRRLDLLIQKHQHETSSITNGNTNQQQQNSDFDDPNNSFDDISDINE